MAHKCQLCSNTGTHKVVWNQYQHCQTGTKIVCDECLKTFKPDTYYQIVDPDTQID